MKLGRNLTTPEDREFWAYVDRVAAEVETWPCWMRWGRCPKCGGAGTCPGKEGAE